MNAPHDPDALPCVLCGHDVQGLSDAAGCPVCRAPVDLTTQGRPLSESEPDHLSALTSGAFLILASTVVVLVVSMTQGVLSGAGVMTPGAGSALEIAIYITNFLAGVAGFVGWWRFSAPDASATGPRTGHTPRVLIRSVIAVQLVISIVGLALLLSSPGALLPQGSAQAPTLSPLALTLSLVNILLSAVWFFASMVYVRWLAPRLGNQKVYKRAQTMLWVGPLLFFPGSCLIVGPLIAIALYWNMIYWVWKDLKAIQAQQQGLDTLTPAP